MNRKQRNQWKMHRRYFFRLLNRREKEIQARIDTAVSAIREKQKEILAKLNSVPAGTSSNSEILSLSPGA